MLQVGQIGIGVGIDLKQLRASWTAAVGSSQSYANAISKVFQKAVSSPAQMVTARATAAASAVRAQAAANASVIKAMAQAQATATKAPVTAAAQARAMGTRAQASAQAQIIRAQATASSQMVRAQGASAAQMVEARGNRMARVVAAVLSPFTALAGSLGRAAGGHMGSPGGAAGAGLAFSVREAADMESRMAGLRRVTGLEGKGLDALTDKLKGMASTMAGPSLSEVFGTAKMASRMGVGTGALAAFTSGVLKTKAALDDMDVETTVTGLSRILNVFGRSQLEAKNLASVLVALDQRSTATGRDLLEIGERIAPMASVFRLTAQQTLALAAAMKEGGVHTEVAATALSQVLGRLADPKFRGAFARAAHMRGDAFNALVKRDPLEAIGAVAKGVRRGDPTESIRLLNHMGLEGQRVRQALLALGSTWGKMAEFQRVANKEMMTGSAVEKAYAIESETAWKQTELLWNNVKLLAAEVGVGFLPVIKAAAKGVRDFATDARAFFEARREMFVGWGNAVARQVSRISLVWREFPTIRKLVQEHFGQFGDRLAEVFDRARTLVGNAAGMLGEFLGDLFDQIGANMAANLSNAFQVGIAKWSGNPVSRAIAGLMDKVMPGTLQAFDDIAKAQEKAQKMQVPPVVPKMGIFDRGRLMQGLPNGMFGALPDREKAIKKLEGQLDEARRRRLLEDAAKGIRDRGDLFGLQQGLMDAAKGMMGPGKALDRLNRQNRERGMPAFRGTEEQAQQIIRAREERRRREQERRDQLFARRHPMGVFEAGAVGAGRGAENLAERFGAGEKLARAVGAAAALAVGGLPGLIRKGVADRDARPADPKAKAKDEEKKVDKQAQAFNSLGEKIDGLKGSVDTLSRMGIPIAWT